jgi:hypothetical protein
LSEEVAMFPVSTVALCGGLAATVLALGMAAPVVLTSEDVPSRVVLRDGTGDVWKVNPHTSAWTLVGDLPAADVRRVVVSHRDRSVMLHVRFENLRRIGVQTYWAGVATPGGDFYVEVTSRPGTRAGRHVLYDGPAGTGIGCARLSHRIDFTTDTVTVRVPRRCLGGPSWVKVNTGNTLVVGDPARHYADNPHNRQPYANVGTRRIYRG